MNDLNTTLSTIWSTHGANKNYEAFRKSKRHQSLRQWVDCAFIGKRLSEFLDSNFLENFRNEDFYGRLWELELVECLSITKIKMIPTKGKGPDFCLELPSGNKVWIEAVLSRPRSYSINEKRLILDVPDDEVALTYSSSLVGKADKIKEKHLKYIGKNDRILIGISAFHSGPMQADINSFLPAVLPIDAPVVYFNRDGSPLDPNIIRPTHTIKLSYRKPNGAEVKKLFLYPGDYFPFIDGVMFSESSNLQRLLGNDSSRFNEQTNWPHILENYSGKKIPAEFTEHFYHHCFIDKNQSIVGMEMTSPKIII